MTSSEGYCKQVVRRAHSSFALSFIFLNAAQRRAMRAVYAFARIVDDIVDGDLAPDDKINHLQMWREEVAKLGHQRVEHPLTSELMWAQQMFRINPLYLRELIDGVAVDLHPHHIPNALSLVQYCYGVAGTVGLLCLPIFGIEENPRTRHGAIALANAFQITNMVRDLRADAQRGYGYLPDEDFRYFGVALSDCVRPSPTASGASRVQELMQYEIARAEVCYGTAWEAFTDAEQRRMKPALVMSMCYRAILHKIARHPLQVLAKRVRLSRREKLGIMGRTLLV